ncbi:MAG: ATP-dependent sacrificial sulfur transferase LarE [Deltaproteobacteria bacterium]|nr:ATP-dependent sacrificial sulfur transferase LarE [Deltaproteobacteria bacterium]
MNAQREETLRSGPIEEKLHALRSYLQDRGPMLVAFSGGVDSSFLLAVAKDVLQERVIALMTVSSSTPPEDHEQAIALAKSLKVELLLIAHDELAIPQYAANPTNRCYFCKDSLYDICRREAVRLSIRMIADGVNVDDLGDYRPGIQAATEYQILHPLVEAEFTKGEIRQASRLLGLPTWEKPASPCLSSRIPYGTQITARMLSQIAQAEAFIRALGFRELRVRHHATSARIELHREDLQKALSPSVISSFRNELKQQGFTSVLLDLEGYRSGVFNETIQK